MREREIHQKTMENEVKIRPNIDTKSIQISYSIKWCQKHRKSSTIEFKREPKNNQKPIKNRFEKKVGKRWSGPPHPGRTRSPVRLLKINKTHTEILQKHYLRRHINKTHTDILQKDTYRHPTDEAKHHFSNTHRAPKGPERIYWTQGSPGLPGNWPPFPGFFAF